MKEYKIKLMCNKEMKTRLNNNEEFIEGTYKKAKIKKLQNGTQELYSYNKKVAIITKGGNFIRLWEGYSLTTMNHINMFREINNMTKINKKEWEKLKINESNSKRLIFVLYDLKKKKTTTYELEQISALFSKATNILINENNINDTMRLKSFLYNPVQGNTFKLNKAYICVERS